MALRVYYNHGIAHKTSEATTEVYALSFVLLYKQTRRIQLERGAVKIMLSSLNCLNIFKK